MGTRTKWTPPSGPDAELIRAGVWWDAVRAPEYLGKRVLDLLGDECGAVVRDPYARRLYWFICPGVGSSWTFPGIAYVQVLGSGCWVVVPPPDRRGEKSLSWVRPADGGRWLTEPALLHGALTAAVAAELGPREQAGA